MEIEKTFDQATQYFKGTQNSEEVKFDNSQANKSNTFSDCRLLSTDLDQVVQEEWGNNMHNKHGSYLGKPYQIRETQTSFDDRLFIQEEANSKSSSQMNKDESGVHRNKIENGEPQGLLFQKGSIFTPAHLTDEFAQNDENDEYEYEYDAEYHNNDDEDYSSYNTEVNTLSKSFSHLNLENALSSHGGKIHHSSKKIFKKPRQVQEHKVFGKSTNKNVKQDKSLKHEFFAFFRNPKLNQIQQSDQLMNRLYQDTKSQNPQLPHSKVLLLVGKKMNKYREEAALQGF